MKTFKLLERPVNKCLLFQSFSNTSDFAPSWPLSMKFDGLVNHWVVKGIRIIFEILLRVAVREKLILVLIIVCFGSDVKLFIYPPANTLP